MTFYRSVADFTDADVDWILRRASQFKAGGPPEPGRDRTVVGLAFLETSLRTRIGFAAAAVRLGATPIEVLGVRTSAVSMPESSSDTIRTLAGYADVVIARVDRPLDLPRGVSVPLLNGGDRGPSAEHPSQALIDIFALSLLPVRLHEQTIALCGDLRMRAARSLLRLLARRPPKRLIIITEPKLCEGLELPTELKALTQSRTLDDTADLDALYVVGIPHGALNEDARARLRVTKTHLDRLPPHAGVYSPLPVIDEVERDALDHPRVRMFEQSDDGVFVRMALLGFLLSSSPK